MIDVINKTLNFMMVRLQNLNIIDSFTVEVHHSHINLSYEFYNSKVMYLSASGELSDAFEQILLRLYIEMFNSNVNIWIETDGLLTDTELPDFTPDSVHLMGFLYNVSTQIKREIPDSRVILSLHHSGFRSNWLHFELELYSYRFVLYWFSPSCYELTSFGFSCDTGLCEQIQETIEELISEIDSIIN